MIMIVVGLILLAYLALCIKRPVWGLGLIVGLLPTYLIRFKIFEIPTTWLEAMLGMFLIAVVTSYLDKAGWVRIKKLGNINWAVAAFVLAAVIATFISPEKMRALGQLKAFFIEPVLFFYAGLIVLNKKDSFKIPLQILFWSTTAISFFGIIQYWTHLFLPLRFWGYGLEVKRITSVFEYPNALALYLAPILILFLVLRIKGTRVVGWVWEVLGLVLMFSALILTSSRGAWAGTTMALTFMALHLSRQSLKKWGIGFVVILLLLSPLIYNRIKYTFHDGASSERITLFEAAWDKIMQEPLVGNGLAGFTHTLAEGKYNAELLNYPHNIILNFWVETGLLGMISFFAIIFFALQKYRTKPGAYKLAAALALVTILVHGLVDVPYFKNDLSILFWFILLILVVEEK